MKKENQLKLSSTLISPQEKLVSPVRIILAAAVFVITLIIIFSGSEQKSTGIKIFSGIEKINALEFQSDNKKYKIIKRKNLHWVVSNWKSYDVEALDEHIVEYFLKLSRLKGHLHSGSSGKKCFTLKFFIKNLSKNVDFSQENRDLIISTEGKNFIIKNHDCMSYLLKVENIADKSVLKNAGIIKKLVLNVATAAGNRNYSVYRKSNLWTIGEKKTIPVKTEFIEKYIKNLKNISFTEFLDEKKIRTKKILSFETENNMNWELFEGNSKSCQVGEMILSLSVNSSDKGSGCVSKTIFNSIKVDLPSIMEDALIPGGTKNQWKKLVFSRGNSSYTLTEKDRKWDLRAGGKIYPGDFISIEEWLARLKKIRIIAPEKPLSCEPSWNILLNGTKYDWKLEGCSDESGFYIVRNSEYESVKVNIREKFLFEFLWNHFVSRDLLDDSPLASVERKFKIKKEKYILTERGKISIESPLDVPFEKEKLTEKISRLKNLRAEGFLDKKPVEELSSDYILILKYHSGKKLKIEFFNKGLYCFINKKWFKMKGEDKFWIYTPWCSEKIIPWKVSETVKLIFSKNNKITESYQNTGTHWIHVSSGKTKIITSDAMDINLKRLSGMFTSLMVEKYTGKFSGEYALDLFSPSGLHFKIYLNSDSSGRIDLQNPTYGIKYSFKVTERNKNFITEKLLPQSGKIP
ncbi:MAG: hypothetical protein JXR95_05935 [Deltaproteobacteria bacterium]|nr:hypothetical protein [Deltaproteobacteria bacterium]